MFLSLLTLDKVDGPLAAENMFQIWPVALGFLVVPSQCIAKWTLNQYALVISWP